MSVPDERPPGREERPEQVYWVTPDEGEPFLTDRWGRPLLQVKEELRLALDLAGRLGVIASEVETLTRGKVFGPQMYRRLETSIGTLHRTAEWNVRVVAAIQQAWLEEQEKRDGKR